MNTDRALRQVVTSGYLPLDDLPWLLARYEGTDWMGPRRVIVYVRVLHRSPDGERCEIRDSYAPEHFCWPEELADCDDESLFEMTANRDGRAAAAYRCRERISLTVLSDEDRSVLEIDRGLFAFAVEREYRNVSDAPLLVQQSVIRFPAQFEHHRHLFWERAFRPQLGGGWPWGDR